MSGIFKTRRRVEFRDTDAAGFIHFSTYFAFMEETEHEFLRSIGLSVMMHYSGEKLSFPRVSARCDFKRTVRFEEIVDIELRIDRVGEKSVTYGFSFLNEGSEIASGAMTAVCCLVTSHPPESIPIPPAIADKLRQFQAEATQVTSDQYHDEDAK